MSTIYRGENVQSIIGAMENRHALTELADSPRPSDAPYAFLSCSRSMNATFSGIFLPAGNNVTPATRNVTPMGTITARKRKDGTIGYTARVRIKKGGAVVYAQTKTFERRQEARLWLSKREGAMAEPGALEQALTPDPPLADVIERYIAESEKEIRRTKSQVLRAIKASDLGQMACSTIGSSEIVSFTKGLNALPQTRGNYLSHLSAIFAVARPAWKYPLDPQAMEDAVAVTKRLGLTGKSMQRTRRPSLAELDRIMQHFTDRPQWAPHAAPMPLIIAFAIFSTRRLEELTRIRWADLQAEHKRIMVRDMKNPSQQIGNNVLCQLVPEALRLIDAMPRTADELLPYKPDTLGAAFTRAMKFLEIEDLHFHDLRHEGISRLFEMGWTIPRVAEVSGHRSWQSLQRYTHLRQTGDKFEGWPWLETLIEGASK